ncbi:LacI family DNA-binding transcriptional regulator [Erythrobacter sp. GH3-10]|uniref:LacI family DNA-binding transcriptional regulator n=1 Tax=Aurantiacibacter rhizosphaerae TaxID=2691582 RepID=A0A844XHE3_9SPHN|nr:LacI family DNA-binding transcriptional regulator [Aurantiacibacter rhizosphaerae]
MTTRVTSFDVAELAGVNQSTVSRALNGDPSITDGTRTRIEEAARKLGYRVDSRAARLRTGLTATIAVVVIARAGLSVTEINPFHYSLLGNVCAAAAARGYQSLVSFQAERADLYSDFIESRQADAVVLLGTSTNDTAWEFHRHMLGRSDVACWGSPFADHRRIASDNRAGGLLATERLIKGGYRNIVFVGDLDDRQAQFRERFEGYQDALEKQGLGAGRAMNSPADTRFEQGRKSAQALIAGDEAFDALFCCCDATALGAIEELVRSGVSVPQQVGVVGFDGLGSGVHSNPPLTTIEPDFSLAGKMLVAAALGEADAGAPHRVPVRLVERSSAL